MNKACNKLKIFGISLFVTCFVFFNAACGLDTFVVMEEPVNGDPIHTPNERTIMFDEKYFNFLTNGKGSYPADFMFLGVDIYYKIYNNQDILSSEVGVLDNLSTDTDNNSKSSDRLRYDSSSGGYGYLPLKATNCKDSPLIKAADNPQEVYIRLTDFQNSSQYAAKILVNGKNLGNSENPTIPLRNMEDYTFNFGRSGEKDVIPNSEQKDVRYSSSSSNHNWYVALFAVGVGRDVSYTPYYSNIKYLGTVPISDDEYDN